MADLTIRKDFIDGINEIYTTLFNEGITDGLNLYLLSEESKPNIYGECKYKTYQEPMLMVCHPNLTPEYGEDPEQLKFSAKFSVPLKAFMSYSLSPISMSDVEKLKKSVIEFHGVYYEVKEVTTRTYVEDVFHFVDFNCKEMKGVTSLNVEEPYELIP